MNAYDRARADAARYTPRFTTEAPRRMVKPMLPNSYDATQGGKASIPQYEANNAAMYQLQPVDQASDLQRIANRYGNGVVTPATSPAVVPIAQRYGATPAMGGMPSQDAGFREVGPSSAAQAQAPGWFQGALADAGAKARGMGPQLENNTQSRWAISGRNSQTPSTMRYYQNKDIRDKRMNPQKQNRRSNWMPYGSDEEDNY
jgi:hypothetical protein